MNRFRQTIMRVSALAVVVAFILPAMAKDVTPDQARNTALQFAARAAAQQTGGRMAPADASALSLAYTARSGQSAQSANYYVFNRAADQGYIIVSGDDRLPSVLGYAPEGSFDPNNMPPAAKWWMEQYSLEIEAFMASNPDEAAAVATADTRKTVTPLLKTMWDQSTPYNDLCPITEGKRSFTGCVATAMAMVLNYHQWPKEPVAIEHTDVNNSNAYFNYNTTYNWDNLLDTYNDESSDAAKAEVAKLMLACGVSVDMQYASSGGGSGAYSSHIPAALRTYFNYDKDVKYVNANYYTTEQWNDIVYNELTTNGPVLYDGQAKEGGHQFVADGYANGGYFHINWGWSGAFNGYFLLSALTPSGQGIGGFEGGYNKNQGIVTGVKPGNGSAADNGHLSIFSYGGYEWDGLVEDVFDNFALVAGDEPGYFYNESPYDFNVYFAMRIEKVGSNEAPVYTYDTEATLMKASEATGSIQAYGSMYFDIRSKNLADGTYRLTPIYAIFDDSFSFYTAEWIDFPIAIGQKNVIEMTKNGSNYSFKTYAEYTPELSFLSAEWSGAHLNTPEKISLELKNSGDASWSGTLTLHVFERSADITNMNNSIWNKEITCNLPGELTTNIEDEFMFTTPYFTTGAYQFVLFDENGQRLGAPMAFDIVDADYPAGVTTAVRVTSLEPATWYAGQNVSLTAGMVNTTSVTQQNVNVFLAMQPQSVDGNYGSQLGVDLNFGNFAARYGGFKSVSVGLPGDGSIPAGVYGITYLQKSTGMPMSGVYYINLLMPYDGVYYGADDRNYSPVGFVGVQPKFEAPAEVVVREKIASVTTDGQATTTVTKIAAGAFADQPFVKKVTLPATIASIGAEAFARTPELTEIVFEGAQPDMEDAESVFAGANPELAVYVKPEYYDQYASVLEGHVGHLYAMIESIADATEVFEVGPDNTINVKVNDGVGRINTAQITATVEEGSISLDECTIYGEPETGVDLLVRSTEAGTAKIKLTADNGVSGTVILTFNAKKDGVESLIADGQTVDVYTVDGVLIAKDADADFVNSLSGQVLILVKDGRAYKVIR